MTIAQFPLPDVGEGLTEAEIVAWRVAPGDRVSLNQVIVEIETAKSLVELPSPFEGIVAELLVAEGQTVEVGTPIIRVDAAGAIPEPPATAPVEVIEAVQDAAATVAEEDEGSGAVLVGYGSSGHVRSRRRAVERAIPASAATPVIAKPPIRALARELGVDLATVMPTGLAGEVVREDVIRHADQAKVFHNIETPPRPTGREERIPVKGVRKAIASAMVASKFTAPHTSVLTEVNATRTMEFVKRLKASPEFAGVRVSPLLVMAKALIWAVRRNPVVNSTWTDEEIIVHHFVNLGIAAATPRGLIVPNVKDAQDLSLLELAKALEQLTLVAREGRTTPQDLQGGTITITNLGSYGIDTGIPILNPGEVSIIVLGAIRQRPWVIDGDVRPAHVTTVGGSFDHRVVDGDVISRFVQDIASVLEEPALLLD
ncbi:MAG: branched-chain alpha-keto acid dehydrogenase subunit E2 [Micrococcales bacterium 73-13]|nr:MAG: branched-chain alpha-keto acid dehydrogenase subunit E2 [Micrococcales bacterium 73-13]